MFGTRFRFAGTTGISRLGRVAKHSLRNVVCRFHIWVQHERKQFSAGQAADQLFQQGRIVLTAGSLSLFLPRTEARTQRAEPVLEFFDFALVSRIRKPAVLLQSLALSEHNQQFFEKLWFSPFRQRNKLPCLDGGNSRTEPICGFDLGGPPAHSVSCGSEWFPEFSRVPEG